MRYGRSRAAGRSGGLTQARRETLDATVAGRRLEILRYRIAPNKIAPIVLLHEGLGSVSAWRDFPKRLAEKTLRDVVVYSRYGYGRSERLAEAREVSYMHDEALHVLPGLLAHLGIARPIVMGHSDGASIAIVFAGAHPLDAAGVILEAPHVFVEDLSVASIARAKEIFETTDLAAKLARHHDDARATFYGWNDIWLDPRFRAWNIEASLAAIQAPVLVLQGRDDEYGTFAQVRAILENTNARAIVLERCGHAPHRDRVERTLDEIASFTERLATR